jgi:hypothetical protein
VTQYDAHDVLLLLASGDAHDVLLPAVLASSHGYHTPGGRDAVIMTQLLLHLSAAIRLGTAGASCQLGSW